MAVDEAKRRQMEELAKRGRSQRDTNNSRMAQTARNTQNANKARSDVKQYQNMMKRDGVVTDREKVMMKQAMRDGVLTERERADMKKAFSRQSEKPAQKADVGKKPAEQKSSFASKLGEKAGVLGKVQSTDAAMLATGLGNAVGSNADEDSSFTRNFAFGVANTTRMGMYGKTLGGFRSDGKVVLKGDKIAEFVQEPMDEKMERLRQMAEDIKRRMDMLQALINEKGMYTGISIAQQADFGPSL